jgi:hypothetical protein
MKEKFIAEIQAFTKDEQIMSAMERVETFPVSDWNDLMEHVRQAALRIQLAKLDQVMKNCNLGE